jgi:hypothetical protein
MGTTGFYSELGKLLYAVANADGTISVQESAEISNQIRERLLHREMNTDRFGSNKCCPLVLECQAHSGRVRRDAFGGKV